jgi:hypothetical protein
MRTFKELFRKKMGDPAFAALYAQECHVCRYTVRIFEKIEDQCIELETLASDMKVGTDALQDLKEANRCNPRLVIDLCRHLALEPPGNCPKLKKPLS